MSDHFLWGVGKVHFGCVGVSVHFFISKWGWLKVYFTWVGVHGHFLWVAGCRWWLVGVSGGGNSF